MKRLLWFMLWIGGVLLYFAYPVQAALITVDFTAIVYGNGDPIPLPPTNPVTGTIVYQADSVTSDITTLTSINLTIDGHPYTVDELAFYNNSVDGTPYQRYIGGSTGGASGLSSGANDFMLIWNSSTNTPGSFGYRSVNDPNAFWTSFITNSFTSFSVRESTASAPVPEPGTMILLGSGLLGLVGYGRRRFKK